MDDRDLKGDGKEGRNGGYKRCFFISQREMLVYITYIYPLYNTEIVFFLLMEHESG